MKAILTLIDGTWYARTEDGQLHEPEEFGIVIDHDTYEGEKFDVSEYYG